MTYIHAKVPTGDRITLTEGELQVPDHPIIPFIEGDGTGPDIWQAAVRVFDAAVEKAYTGKRRISWMEVYAGEKAFNMGLGWLPDETVQAFGEFLVGIKGPLTTPIGGGIRSLNVALRQILDLYVCLRPVRYFSGVPSPVKKPEDVDMAIFRENTEDIYAGIEWPADSDEARKVIDFLQQEMGIDQIRFPEGCGIGIKPISRQGTSRLVRAAIRYALKQGRRSLTLVHKGNIMKYTEGAFRDWGYELAESEFSGQTVREDASAEGKLVIKDRIADNMFQQALLRPADYQVLATPNLNGDYLSDALAAQVGGLGMAPGANIGDQAALFEATHGSAPKYAGQDKVNPGSLVLSGAMLLEHLGWREAADLVPQALSRAIQHGQVTYDLARQIEGAQEVACSTFAQRVAGAM